MMFNAAGLHPDTVAGMAPASGQFLQYRTTGDPLTAVQNSAALQSAATGVAGVVGMPLGTGVVTGHFITQKLGLPSLGPDAAALASQGTTAFAQSLGNLTRQGYLLPPARGQLVEVSALAENGAAVAPADLDGQHSVRSVIHGIEQEKSQDIETLQS